MFSKSVQEPLENLNMFMNLTITHDLKLKISIVFFFKKEVKLLGHIFDAFGVSADPNKKESIQ